MSMSPNNKELNHSLRLILPMGSSSSLLSLFQATFPSGSLFLGLSDSPGVGMVLGRCGSWVQLLPPSPQPTAPFPLVTETCAESQAALGHLTLWPLGRDGLRRFPKIFLCWGQECKWKPLALTLVFAVCPHGLLLVFISQSIFIQCILISKSDLKNSIFQNWAIYPNITSI